MSTCKQCFKIPCECDTKFVIELIELSLTKLRPKADSECYCEPREKQCDPHAALAPLYAALRVLKKQH